MELWEKDNIIPIFKKGEEQDPGNSQPHLSPGKIMLDILFKSLSKCLTQFEEITDYRDDKSSEYNRTWL